MLNKGKYLFPLVKRKCWGSTFSNLWLTLGDLLVQLIIFFSGKSFWGLKNESFQTWDKDTRLIGMMKLVLWGKTFYLPTENHGHNAYWINRGSQQLLKFCLFFLEELLNRHCMLQILHNYLLHQTEFIVYVSLSLSPTIVTSPSIKAYEVPLMYSKTC